MLIINAFKPVTKAYSNQNNNNQKVNNFGKVQFRSGVDSVSFKGLHVEELRMKQIMSGVLKEYSDVLGPNFKKAVLVPMNSFLAEHGAFISHHSTNVDIRTHRICLNSGHVRNASTATFVDKYRSPMHEHSYQSFSPEFVYGLTDNESKIRLFGELLDGKLNHYHDSALENAIAPEKLSATINKVRKALNALTNEWVDTTHSNDDLKAAGLQRAIQELLPE